MKPLNNCNALCDVISFLAMKKKEPKSLQRHLLGGAVPILCFLLPAHSWRMFFYKLHPVVFIKKNLKSFDKSDDFSAIEFNFL